MKKRATTAKQAMTDLSAQDASTVKGGTENVTFNYARVSVEYHPQN
jgi:hypothetical protein